MNNTVGDDFPRQQKRVREVLVKYQNIGPAGMFGAMMIKQALDRAERAAISGDLVEILMAYQELKEIE